ncbi:MAG: hypothetical protein LRY37_00575 [Alkalibacterium thalassium]|nr:hypothetical protein [Alkalibacterium thalassium]
MNKTNLVRSVVERITLKKAHAAVDSVSKDDVDRLEKVKDEAEAHYNRIGVHLQQLSEAVGKRCKELGIEHTDADEAFEQTKKSCRELTDELNKLEQDLKQKQKRDGSRRQAD